MSRRKLFNFIIIVTFLPVILWGGLVGLAQAASGITSNRIPQLQPMAALTVKPVETKPHLELPVDIPAHIPLLQGASVLTITKTADPDPATAGEVLTYTIVVTNGDINPSDILITDTLDNNVSFASASDGGTHSSGVVTWNAGTISAGSTVTRTVQVTVGQVISGTILTNTVEVTSTAGFTDSDTITTNVIAAADLAITKTNNQIETIPGQPITYTIVVSNNGPSDVTGATVTDNFPGGLTGVSWSCASCTPNSGVGNLNNTVNLPAGGQVTYIVTGTVSAAISGTLTNTASVTVPTGVADPISINNTSTDVDTLTPQADLLISKSGAPEPVIAGNSLTYTLTITNSGPSDAVSAVVTDTLPAGVTFVSAPSCANSGNIVTCTLGSLVNNAITTRTIQVSIPSSTPASTLQNSVVISSATSDPLTTNNVATSSTTVNVETNLEISKSDSSDPVVAGRTLTYTLAITNHGPSDATGVVVTDTLPATGVSLVTATASQGSGCSGATSITCNLGSLTSSSRATVTVVVNVSPAMTGTLTNTATVGSATTDSTPGNNSDTESTAITPEADLVISKNDTPEPVIAGQRLTYTIAITNNGPSYAQNVIVTDTLPVSLSLVSVTPATTTQNGQILAWNFGTLINGATQAITLVVTVGGDVRGQINNTATITSSATDPTPGNNSDTEPTTVNGQADLIVSKSDFPDPIGLQAGFLGYTIQITNTGPSDALAVALTDNLPGTVSHFSTIPSQGNCSGASPISCNLGKIASNSSASVNILVTPSVPGIITNTVNVTSSEFDPNTSNNTDMENTTINPSNLSITKSDTPDPVLVGNPLTYTLTVANSSSSSSFDATSVVVTDTLSSGVNLKSASASQGSGCSGTTVITCDLGDVDRGANATVTLVVTPTVAGVITNTAIVTSSNPDLTPTNNTTSITTTVSPVANLSIAKIDTPDPVTAGTSLTYTLSISNAGPSSATGVVVTDILPAGVTLASAPGCTGTGPVTCNLGTMTSGSAATVTIRVTVNAGTTGILTNTASVAGTEFDSNTANNTASITTTVNRQVNLSLTKSDLPDPVAAGATLTYTLTISNAGPSSATGVVVTDTLPANVTVASAPGCSGANPLICNVGTVASGGTAVVTIRVTPASSLAAGTILTNTATVSSDVSDSSPANNTTAITTTIIRRTDLSVTKSDTPDPVTAGSNVTYNVTVTNNGPSNATGVVVTDTLPAGVTLVSAPGCTGTTILTCNLGNMASGGQASISIVVSTNLLATGSLVNNVSVSGVETDPNPGNNSTSATTTISPITFLYLPIVIKPGVTDLFIENDTGGIVTFTVLGAGVSCTVPAGDQNFFCGSFPSGTYTVQVVSICGTGTATKVYENGPQSTRVFCN